MTRYEYDQHVKGIKLARAKAKRAKDRGDEIAQEHAWHEQEMHEYALGRLAEGQTPIKRSMTERNNPPSGFIPCKAVKITRNRGRVEVRIRQ